MNRFDLFFDRIDYYLILLVGFALIGLIGFSLLSREQKRKKELQFSLSIVVLVAFYENLAGLIGSQGIVSNWVYNMFNGHIAPILFFLLIRSFLKEKHHKNVISFLMVFFLVLSSVLHLLGFVHYNDAGEYISFINSVLILCSCGLYFYELITLDEFLEVNPLREFSFWASTAILFYFSSSFMVYISYVYLVTNHLDIFYMVIEIPKTMAILCNLLLCLGIFSLVVKNRFQKALLHV